MEHPGVLFRQEWFKGLDDREIASELYRLSSKIGVPIKDLVDFLDGKRDIDDKMADLLARQFPASAAYWLAIQDGYNESREK